MTIRHVVSWQLSSVDPGEKAENAAKIAAALTSLRGVIDGVQSIETGTDVVGGENWDVVLIADFDDRDALDRYQGHPEHQRVAGFIRSVVARRSCVDFEVP
ncbi:MAG: stress responsive alpha-beta barrel protein [Cryobacterium sp.]|jgi:hypothetical protein|nr:stress responsive alpha-beta barrel protein [Cryobacterium sp.]